MILLYWHPHAADETLSVQLYPLAGGASIADEELADTTTPPGLYAADIGSPAAYQTFWGTHGGNFEKLSPPVV